MSTLYSISIWLEFENSGSTRVECITVYKWAHFCNEWILLFRGNIEFFTRAWSVISNELFTADRTRVWIRLLFYRIFIIYLHENRKRKRRVNRMNTNKKVIEIKKKNRSIEESSEEKIMHMKFDKGGEWKKKQQHVHWNRNEIVWIDWRHVTLIASANVYL